MLRSEANENQDQIMTDNQTNNEGTNLGNCIYRLLIYLTH